MPYLGNVPSSFNVGTNNIDNDAITTEKIAAGAVVNADVNAAAAIAGTKISPDFGSQNILTTGTSTAASFSPSSSSVPTNGFYLPSANNVAISTNGTGRLFVSSTGSVGIGAASPSTLLELGGVANPQLTLNGTTTNGQRGLIFSHNGTAYGQIGQDVNTGEMRIRSGESGQSGYFITFGTGGTEYMRLTSAGLLGLGTSSPSALLHVQDSSSTTTTPLILRNYAASVNSKIRIALQGSTASGQGANAYIQSLSGTDAGGSNSNNDSGLQFIVTNGGGATENQALTINTQGRVGIGTTTASDTLHVKGSFRVEDSGSTANTRVFYDSVRSSDYLTLDGTGASGFVSFRTGASITERARIDSSGRLLVGTSTGSKVLTVNQIGGDGDGIQLTHPTRAGKWLISHSGTASENLAFIQNNGTTDNTSYVMGRNEHRISTGNVERWVIDSAGSLIGASGSAFVAPYIYNATTASATNVHVTSGGFLQRSTSSIKYKTNVETIQDQYADAILGCRPVWYQSTCEADKPDWSYWGFIAEEVAAIDPRLCFFKEEEDGTLEPEGVQYDRFVPHLLNLIKRQKEQIEAMEARLSALEAS